MKIYTPDKLTYENWKHIRRFVFKEIKDWYSHLLSDSRFPVNDVTLWDQAYMTASLFKAAVAAMLLDGKICEQYETPKNIKWIILGIQYDKLSLISKSLKAHFISWYNESIRVCDEKVKEIIEEKYALGNEIYRGETGIYFLVPVNISNNEINNEFSCLNNSLNEMEKDILNVFQEIYAGEIYPSIFVTKPSRGTMNLTHLIEKSKECFLSPSLPEKFAEDMLTSWSCSGCYNGICQICNMRPGRLSKYDKDGMVLCEQCSIRKEKRINKWIENQESETIWIGELQDVNGRIALIVLKFELQNWLNGDLLNTIIINDEAHKKYQATYNNIKELLTNIHTVFQSFVSGNDNNLSKFYRFITNNGIYIEEFLCMFDEMGIKKPYENIVIEDIENIANRQPNNRLKRLFENEFFGFIKKNWNYTSGNKDDNKYIIFDENGDEIYDIKAKKINLRNKQFKTCYNGDQKYFWNLLKDIFSFAYIETQINGILLERSVGDRWETFIREKLDSKIDFDNRKIEWHKLNNENIDFLSRLLLQYLTRKNPSPARLRRISETTKEFFEEIQGDEVNFISKDFNNKNNWRNKRIVWHVDNLKDYQINKEYEYKGIEFVSDGCGNVYLISSIEKAIDVIGKTNSENKGKNDGKEKIFEEIKSNNFDWLRDEIEIEPIQKRDNRDGENEVIKLRKENAKYKNYLPYISITHPTPTMWQFAVPAECIPQVIKTVIDKYNQHFKYVIGKLPLHIGIIVQDYKKPLYVGLKALENIKRDICELNEIKTEISAVELNVLRKMGISNEIPREKSEPLEDVYSLYEVKNNSDGSASGRYKIFINPDKKEAVWIDKPDSNEKNKMFYIYPNTFDFEFLDVNTRRNDMFYGKDGKRVTVKKNRPYTWREWDLFAKFFEYFNKENYKTKLQNIISLIYSKLEDWGDDCEEIKKFTVSSLYKHTKLEKQ